MSGEDATDEIGYSAAITELEEILGRLESDDVDVDVLGAEVTRAAELISICRSRLSAAELQVRSVVAELAPDDD